MDRIYLNRNWDRPLSWQDLGFELEETDSYFVDYPASKRISDFICRKKTGSLLVSGDRGVGKTSMLIHKLLSDYHDKLVIPLNILELESLNNGVSITALDTISVLKQMMLSMRSQSLVAEDRNLIKRWLRNHKIKVHVVSRLDVLLDVLAQTEITYTAKSSETSIKTKTKNFSIEALLLWVYKVFKGTVEVDYTYSARRERLENTLFEQKKVGYTLDEVTRYFSYLLFNTEKILGKQVLFVVDELDFYDTDDNPRKLLEVLKKLKNLITLSRIQFIFVVGKNTFTLSLSDNSFLTMFSDRVFLTKPRGKIFSEYMDITIDKELTYQPRGDIDWEMVKWSVIGRSRGNFYNLIQTIKEMTEFDDDGNLLLKQVLDNEKDKVVASLCRAMDEIYGYYLPEVKEHYLADVLYAELYSVVTSFISWTPLNLTPQVFFNTHGSLDTSLANISPEQRYLLSRAKRGFVRYLYQICDITNVAPLADDTQDGFDVNWSQIQEKIDFQTTLRGVKGAVTQDDLQFRNALAELYGLLNHHLKLLGVRITTLDLPHLRTAFDRTMWLRLPENAYTKVLAVNSIVNEVPLHEREKPLETIKEGILAIDTLVKFLNDNYYEFKSSLFEKHWGVIDFSLNIVKLGYSPDTTYPVKLASKVLLLDRATRNEKQGKRLLSITIEFDVLISKGALLNVLLGLDHPDDNRFYMVRFDSRNVENGTESCVLLKDSGGSWRPVENNIKNSLQFPSEEKVSVRCEYVESKIKAFYKLKSQKNYTLLCEHTINEENASGCTHIGFGNELGEVTISNIRNKTIVFH